MTDTTTQKKSTVRAAVAEQTAEPRSVAIAKRYEGQFADVLPDHIDAKAFVGSAVAALRKNPDLLAAANNNVTAFTNALMECAALGHVPGGKEFYLTIRGAKQDGGGYRPEVVGLEGYQGVIERMYRSGAVASVIVREVCQGDRFQFVEGVDEVPLHEFDPFGDERRDTPEAIIGVYAYARLTTGATSRVVLLNKADLDAAKSHSDLGKKDKGPWKDNYRAMVWKTAAHRLEPWVPTSVEYRREVARAEGARSRVQPPEGVDVTTGEIVDAEVVE